MATTSYMSPAGTPLEQRSLPPGKIADTYEQYKVLKPFATIQETIAPAFGQTGGGTQIRAFIPEYLGGAEPAPIKVLIKEGYLK